MHISSKELRELAISTRTNLTLNGPEILIPAENLKELIASQKSGMTLRKIKPVLNDLISPYAIKLAWDLFSTQRAKRAIKNIKQAVYCYAILGKFSAPVYTIAPFEIERPKQSKYSECDHEWLTSGAKKVWSYCQKHKLKPKITLFHGDEPKISYFMITCNW